MQEILQIINNFNRDQRYVKDWLAKFMGMKDSMSGVDWFENKRRIHDLTKKIPLALEFRPHGVGLHFRDEKVSIDFDFSRSGRDGGFDAWRLYIYCELNNIPSTLKTHNDFIDALQKLHSSNVIEKEDVLYFLK